MKTHNELQKKQESQESEEAKALFVAVHGRQPTGEELFIFT